MAASTKDMNYSAHSHVRKKSQTPFKAVATLGLPQNVVITFLRRYEMDMTVLAPKQEKADSVHVIAFATPEDTESHFMAIVSWKARCFLKRTRTLSRRIKERKSLLLLS